MASLKVYAYGLLILLSAYWLHQGWKTLVAKGRQATFRRDQRRKAGIPDTDARPFSIAAAEAAQSRRRKELTKIPPRPRGSDGNDRSTTTSQKPSYSPFSSSGLTSRATQHSYSISDRGSSGPSGLHLRRSSPLLSQSVASRAARLDPEQSSRYDPATYVDSSRTSPHIDEYAFRRTAGSKRPAGRALSDAGSEAGTLQPQRRFKHQREDESQVETRTTWVPTTTTSEDQWDAGRGRKRGAQDAREEEEEDSVFAGRGHGKRGRQYELSEEETETSDTEKDSEEEGGERRISSDVRTGGKRKQDQLSVGTGAEEEEEGEDEEDDIPRRRGAKLAAKPVKARKLVDRKQPQTNRTLRDEMMMLDQDETDLDDSLQSQRSRAAVTSNKKAASLKTRDVPDEERQLGEEWTDGGLQWRMDEDDVLTEEEGSTSGRKRRVMVRRRVKRRLTVKREMRKKWEMPADSLHPDNKEMVPHYVPAWLSEAEFESAKRNGDLGFQVGDSLPASPGPIAEEGRSSPGRSSRNLDRLFHQPANPRPLSASRLGTSIRSSLTPGLRTSTSNSSFGGGASKKPGGRISLAGASSSASSDSPLRSRVLDTAGKRRREEELLRKLRDSNRAQSSAKSTESELAPGSFAPPVAPAIGAGQTAKNQSGAFSFNALGSEANEVKQEVSAGDSKSVSAPITFGVVKNDPPKGDKDGSKSGSAAPFSFGAPTTQAAVTKPSVPESDRSSAAPSSFTFAGHVPGTSDDAPAVRASSTPFSFGPVKKESGEGSVTAANPVGSGGGAPFSFGLPSGNGTATSQGSVRRTSTLPLPFGKSQASGAPIVNNNNNNSNGPNAPKTFVPFSFGAPSLASGSVSDGVAGSGAVGDTGPAKAVPFTFGQGGMGSGTTSGQGQSGGGGGVGGVGGFTFSFGKK